MADPEEFDEVEFTCPKCKHTWTTRDYQQGIRYSRAASAIFRAKCPACGEFSRFGGGTITVRESKPDAD